MSAINISLIISLDTFPLEEAIEIAIRRNPQILSSAERAKAISPKLFSSYFPPNPIFTYRAMFESDNISIAQPIPFPTILITRGQLANDEYNKFYYLYKAKILEIIRNVKESYYDYFLAYKKIEITNEIIKILENIKEIASKRYETGSGELWDVLKADIELEKAKNEIKIFESEKQSALSQLKALLDSSIQEFIPQEIELKDEIYQNEFLKSALSEKNPNIKVYELDFNLNKKEKSIAIQSLFPEIMPEILYNTRTGERNFLISFEIPILSFLNFSKIKETSSKIKASEYELKNIEVELNQRIDALISMHNSKLERYKLFKDVILPKAENAFKSAQAGYITSKLDFLTYIQAQKVLFDVKIEYYSALVDVLKIRAEIEEITGGVL